MAINYDTILDSFISVARDGVGNSLSTIGALDNIPAVIRSRQDGPIPDYPYIVVDVLNTSETNGWQNNEGIDENGDYFITTHYKLLLQYTIYGGNANSIAHDLRQYFRLERVRMKLTNETTGTLENTFGVSSLPQRLSTANMEVASFNLTFNITDRYVDTGTGLIDTVEIEDSLLYRHEDDPSPLTINITETSGVLPPP